MLDLKKWIAKVTQALNTTPTWTYVGDVYWWQNSWTCPEDGFIEVNVNPSANGWYYRISDSTHPDTGWSHRMGGYYQYSQSQTYFVKKGAVLKNHSMGNVASVNVWYYKFNKLGGVARKLLKALKMLTSERGWVFC